MKLPFERVFALILIIIGVTLIVFAVFQAFFHEQELSLFVETLREGGIGGLEALGHNFAWFFALLTELIGGFFLASIGTKIIKK